MKVYTLFVVVFISLCASAQQMAYLYENDNNRLRLTIVREQRFDLDYRYKRFEAGVVDWEQGDAKVRKSRIVLISDKPETATSLNKMILKLSNSNDGKSCYFIDEDSVLWRISSVKNKKFEFFLLTAERTDLLYNNKFPE